MDYWRLIKEEENLTSKELDEAGILFSKQQDTKKGALKKYDPSLKIKQSGSLTRSRKRKRVFRGWGSVELIEFLASLGKDVSQPLDQWNVYNIIEGYIHENSLLLPEKKKKTIFCDHKLITLLGKVKVKVSKVYNLLEGHFAANVDKDDSFISLEEDSFNLESKKKMKNSEIIGVIEGKFAAVTHENLNLIYLRKSLIMELLKLPEVFENKVTGCFVRIKNERKDIDCLHNKVHILWKISGLWNFSFSLLTLYYNF